MNIAIEQIQHGNEQAFKSLFDEYYQGLCVFASAYLKDDDLSAGCARGICEVLES